MGRSRRTSIAVLASAALGISLLGGPPGAQAIEPDADRAPEDVSTLDAAIAEAREKDQPVEDLGQRTESTSVIANPDGTLTHRDFGDAIRFKRDNEWVDVDYDLVKKADGSFVPKASPIDVSIGSGPATEAARLTFGKGKAIAVTWPTDLPEPSIDGGVATYELSDATDLLIITTSEGLKAHLRLNQQPKDDDPVFTFGLRTKGVDVDETDDGSLEITNDDGETVGSTATLVAWDAEVDEAGEPTETVNLDAELTETSSSGQITDHALDLTAPEGFLSDPETEYPVTIDPDIKVTNSPRDIWVRSGVTEGQGSDSTLRVGKIYNHSNTNPARSYVWFSTPSAIGSRRDVQVTSAKLNLWQYYGFTCSNKRMNVHPTKDAWGGNITWPDRPTSHLQDSYYAWISANRGTSGCARNWSTVDVTKIAKAWWQTREITNNGFTLLAWDESNHDHERRFCSKENDSSHTYCNTASRRPYLDVTFTVPPNSPAKPTVAKDDANTVLSAKVSDPLNARVRARFVVKSGSTTVFDGYSPFVASNTQASVSVPNLSQGVYDVTVRTYSDSRQSTSNSTATFAVNGSGPGPVPGGEGDDEGGVYTFPDLDDETEEWSEEEEPEPVQNEPFALVEYEENTSTADVVSIAEDNDLVLDEIVVTADLGNGDEVTIGFDPDVDETVTVDSIDEEVLTAISEAASESDDAETGVELATAQQVAIDQEIEVAEATFVGEEPEAAYGPQATEVTYSSDPAPAETMSARAAQCDVRWLPNTVQFKGQRSSVNVPRRFGRTDFKWTDSSRIAAIRDCSRPTLEVDIIQYTRTGIYYQKGIRRWLTNMPSAYKDTQLFDRGSAYNLSVGTKDAEKLRVNRPYYTYFRTKNGNLSRDYVHVQFQRGEHLPGCRIVYTCIFSKQTRTYIANAPVPATTRRSLSR